MGTSEIAPIGDVNGQYHLDIGEDESVKIEKEPIGLLGDSKALIELHNQSVNQYGLPRANPGFWLMPYTLLGQPELCTAFAHCNPELSQTNSPYCSIEA